MAKPHPTSPTFEQAIRELEKIISELEAGELTLEENLTRYERGRFLIQHCCNALDQAQLRIDKSTPAAIPADDLPTTPEAGQESGPGA